MKRNYLALGTSIVLLAFGGGTALANGSHGAPGNSASQSSSSAQILPISLGAGVALPINANVPVGILSSGPAQGAVSQQGAAAARGTAANRAAVQSVRQQGAGGNAAGQSASSSQILPIAAGVGVAAPVNANVPVAVLSSGPRQGDVAQEGRAQASGAAKNAETAQSVRQQGAGAGNSASQSASSSQILPIALGLGLAAPVNANVPVAVLSSGPRQGALSQRGDATASVGALNHELDQAIEQRGDRGSRAGNSASQSASSSQILPIALGLGLAAPVNANVPVAVLSSGPAQGDVSQRGDADATAEALNDETEQTVRQDGARGERGNSASQSASSSQILPIALGAALGLPINANVPVALLSSGPAQGDVDQHGDAGVRARAANLEHDQDIRQRGGGEGGGSATQSASSSQILPISLGAALGIPINANVPVSILSSGPVQGDVSQRGDADAAAEALSNETEQTIRQDGAGPGTASQSASSSQILPIALGAALGIPINANVPVSILSSGPAQGDVSQRGDADAAAEALNHETDQAIEAAGAAQRLAGGASASQSSSSSQILPIALGAGVAAPLNVNLPIGILSGPGGPPLGLGVVNTLLSTVQAVLADPFGTVSAVLSDPAGAVTGLLASL